MLCGPHHRPRLTPLFAIRSRPGTLTSATADSTSPQVVRNFMIACMENRPRPAARRAGPTTDTRRPSSICCNGRCRGGLLRTSPSPTGCRNTDARGRPSWSTGPPPRARTADERSTIALNEARAMRLVLASLRAGEDADAAAQAVCVVFDEIDWEATKLAHVAGVLASLRRGRHRHRVRGRSGPQC